MRRATITLPDDLETQLDAFLRRAEPTPSLTAVVQAALRQYLAASPSAPNPPSSAHRSDAAVQALWDSPLSSHRTPRGVAEPVVPYGSPAGGNRQGWWQRDTVTAGDLAAVLDSLPRLAVPEADAFADDLERSRRELASRNMPDRWNDA